MTMCANIVRYLNKLLGGYESGELLHFVNS